MEIKRFKFILLSVLITIVSSAQMSAYEVETNGFILRGADADSIIVNELARDIRQNTGRYESFFGIRITGKPVEILIPENKEEYGAVTFHTLPEWSQGVAIPDRRRVIMRPADYYIPALYREILFHEMAHIYLALVTDPQRIPLWFNEGLAMYMSEKVVTWEDGIVIGSALVGNRFIGFQDIDSLLYFGEAKARLAYLQSFLAVRQLISVHGPGIMPQILNACARGDMFEDAFINLTGYDLIDFEDDVYLELKDKYQWMSWLQFSNIFWILMVILVITVFIAIKYRNRKKIKQWDLVEED